MSIDNKKINMSQDHIIIKDIFKFLWSEKNIIIISLIFFISITSYYSLSLPNIYTSKALLQISKNVDSAKLSSISSRYLELSNISGLGFSSNSDSSKRDLAIATLTSKDFFKILLDKHNLAPLLVASDSYDFNKNEIIFDNEIYNKGEWVEGMEPSYIEAHNFFLKNTLQVAINRDTQHIQISISHISPYLAEEMLRICLEELNLKLKNNDLAGSSKAISFIKNSLATTQTNEMKNSLNSLLEKQLEIQMLASIDDDYVLEKIDSPFIPNKPSSPNRLFIILMGAMFGILIGSVIAFIKK